MDDVDVLLQSSQNKVPDDMIELLRLYVRVNLCGGAAACSAAVVHQIKAWEKPTLIVYVYIRYRYY